MEQLPWFLRFLSDIGKFNQIEEITLEVGIPGYVKWSGWEEIDSILAGAGPYTLSSQHQARMVS
jgi:hypothetical protein